MDPIKMVRELCGVCGVVDSRDVDVAMLNDLIEELTGFSLLGSLPPVGAVLDANGRDLYGDARPMERLNCYLAYMALRYQGDLWWAVKHLLETV